VRITRTTGKAWSYTFTTPYVFTVWRLSKIIGHFYQTVHIMTQRTQPQLSIITLHHQWNGVRKVLKWEIKNNSTFTYWGGGGGVPSYRTAYQYEFTYKLEQRFSNCDKSTTDGTLKPFGWYTESNVCITGGIYKLGSRFGSKGQKIKSRGKTRNKMCQHYWRIWLIDKVFSVVTGCNNVQPCRHYTVLMYRVFTKW
jgi:hypothetical protein